jgi:hypothetical protein
MNEHLIVLDIKKIIEQLGLEGKVYLSEILDHDLQEKLLPPEISA